LYFGLRFAVAEFWGGALKILLQLILVAKYLGLNNNLLAYNTLFRLFYCKVLNLFISFGYNILPNLGKLMAKMLLLYLLICSNNGRFYLNNSGIK